MESLPQETGTRGMDLRSCGCEDDPRISQEKGRKGGRGSYLRHCPLARGKRGRKKVSYQKKRRTLPLFPPRRKSERVRRGSGFPERGLQRREDVIDDIWGGSGIQSATAYQEAYGKIHVIVLGEQGKKKGKVLGGTHTYFPKKNRLRTAERGGEQAPKI